MMRQESFSCRVAARSRGKRSGVRNLGFSVERTLLSVRRSQQVCASLPKGRLSDIIDCGGNIYTTETGKCYKPGLI